MNLRAWISTIATVGATSSFGVAQNPPPTSSAPAALAAQTSVIHPANTNPVITMRTAGQPDRALRVLKMNDAPDADTLAEVQDVQNGRVFSMPGKVVKAMLAGTKPPTPAPTPAIVSDTPVVAVPQAAPAKPAMPVFQPKRIASSIYERPAMAAPVREIPTVTAVQTIVPNPRVPQAIIPKMEAVPEHEKARILESLGGSPLEAKAPDMPMIVEPPMPVIEPVPAPAPEVTPIAKLVPTPAPVPAPAPEVTPIAKLVPTPAPLVAQVPAPIAAPAPAPVFVATPTPKPAPVPAKPAAAPVPQFGTPLQAAQSSSTCLKAVPIQTWQPLRDSNTPSNNSIWQPLTTPTPTQMPTPQSMQTKPETTTVTTRCHFECPTECAEPKAVATVEPQVRLERTVAKCNNLAHLEAQVRESCQSSIYDLCTATQPVLREEAATKLSTGRFAQRPEVKAALYKAAVGDPAPSVRAHCIECLMKLGHDEAGFRVHLQGVSEGGPKIVQTAARTALANLPRE